MQLVQLDQPVRRVVQVELLVVLGLRDQKATQAIPGVLLVLLVQLGI